ncbi:MAG: hypothetical protein QXP55_03680 [Nitrososphaerales archaeon]
MSEELYSTLKERLIKRLENKNSVELLDKVLNWLKEGGGKEVERKIRERVEMIMAGVEGKGD